jgi:hypothetical protein
VHNELEGMKKEEAMTNFNSLHRICLSGAQQTLGQPVPSPKFNLVTFGKRNFVEQTDRETQCVGE